MKESMGWRIVQSHTAARCATKIHHVLIAIPAGRAITLLPGFAIVTDLRPGQIRRSARHVIQTRGYVVVVMKTGERGKNMDGAKLLDQQDLIAKTAETGEAAFEECVDLLSGLVSCRSLSGHEKECADMLLEYFQRHDIPCFRDSRGSVLAVSMPGASVTDMPSCTGDKREWLCSRLQYARENGLKILAFNAHLDVVSADDVENWSNDPFSAVRLDGRIYWLGTCDMKGALAAMSVAVFASRELDKLFARKSVVLGCFCTEEEAGEGLAFKELCEEFGIRPDMVLLGEPSRMQIARGQRGKLECYIETEGVCAHTSVPETGVSAVYKLAKVLSAIEKLDADERARHGTGSENILKRTTVVATSLQSWPQSKSFVPNRAVTHVTARLAKGENLATLGQKLQADPEWPDAVIRPIIYRGASYTGKPGYWPSEHPAWETEKGHWFFEQVAGAYEELFGERPVDKIWPFSTDGVYSAGMAGIPTLGIGPGLEEMAHKVDEWVSCRTP
jgi:putative selenium metabolism hydrolase